VRQHFASWLLSGAFRDALEAVSAYLEEAYRVLCLWTLAPKDGVEGAFSQEQWEEAYANRPKRFHRLGLPDKFKRLHEEFGLRLPEDAEKQLLEFNAVRNCLVHRGGVVQQADAKPSGDLAVHWNRVSMVAKGPEGERELIPGLVIKEGESIVMRSIPQTKTFPLGEAVSFDVEEFAGIYFTLLVAMEPIHSNLVERHVGRSRPDE
jgi:hypothetical protein